MQSTCTFPRQVRVRPIRPTCDVQLMQGQKLDGDKGLSVCRRFGSSYIHTSAVLLVCTSPPLGVRHQRWNECLLQTTDNGRHGGGGGHNDHGSCYHMAEHNAPPKNQQRAFQSRLSADPSANPFGWVRVHTAISLPPFSSLITGALLTCAHLTCSFTWRGDTTTSLRNINRLHAGIQPVPRTAACFGPSRPLFWASSDATSRWLRHVVWRNNDLPPTPL